MAFEGKRYTFGYVYLATSKRLLSTEKHSKQSDNHTNTIRTDGNNTAFVESSYCLLE